MQLMIDIATETPAALRITANFLIEHAVLRELMESGEGMPPPPPAGDTRAAAPSAPPAPPVPLHAAPPPPVVHSSAPDLPPPPPLPPVPPAPIATAPAGITANLPLAPVPVGADEFDASGVPFDGRIHQKAKSKKKDGTWKIRKGLDAAIVEAVMRELSPRVRGAGTAPPPPSVDTPDTAGASAPVPLPPPPPPPAHTASLAPPPPPPQEPYPYNDAAQTQSPPLDPFRALVAKITKARAAQLITGEEVNQSVTAAGCPSLNLLNNMPHLIPAVEASIDAILATR